MSKSKKVCKQEKSIKPKKEKFKKSNNDSLNNLKIKFSNDQIEAQSIIDRNDIILLTGNAGCGKTFTACYKALKALFDTTIDKIIITRPMIGTEDMGFLPGYMEEKYQPWLLPIIQNFGKMFNPAQIKAFLDLKNIEMLPLQFTRGITYDNAYVIIDEAQNLTLPQVKMCMTRIGEGSKIIFTGDLSQIDLKKKSDSGFKKVIDAKFEEEVDNFAVCKLQTEFRKQIVIDVLKQFDKIEK